MVGVENFGKFDYNIDENIRQSRRFSRSLYVSKNKKGEIFTENNIKSVRPGYGIT